MNLDLQVRAGSNLRQNQKNMAEEIDMYQIEEDHSNEGRRRGGNSRTGLQSAVNIHKSSVNVVGQRFNDHRNS